MSDASEVKQSDIYVHHQSGKAFILAELHHRIVSELKAEVVRLKEVIQHDVDKVESAYSETIARQARVIEKLKEQRDNLIPAALAEYATPMQVSDYRESLEYDIKDIEQEEKGT